MLARVEQERLESLKYERATIYIKCIDENGETKTENDSEVVCASVNEHLSGEKREREHVFKSALIPSSADDRRDRLVISRVFLFFFFFFFSFSFARENTA